MAQIPQDFIKFVEEKAKHEAEAKAKQLKMKMAIDLEEKKLLDYIHNALKPYHDVKIDDIIIKIERDNRCVAIRLNGILVIVLLVKTELQVCDHVYQCDCASDYRTFIEVRKPHKPMWWTLQESDYKYGQLVAESFFLLLDDFRKV